MRRTLASIIALAALAGAALAPGCNTKESCPADKDFYGPGCAEGLGEALEEAGCYAPCSEEGAACDDGTCRTVVINPCPCEPGQACCEACGSGERLCVP